MNKTETKNILVYVELADGAPVKVSAEALAALGPTVTTLARAEGLPAHASAVEVRLTAAKMNG